MNELVSAINTVALPTVPVMSYTEWAPHLKSRARAHFSIHIDFATFWVGNQWSVSSSDALQTLVNTG